MSLIKLWGLMQKTNLCPSYRRVLPENRIEFAGDFFVSLVGKKCRALHKWGECHIGYQVCAMRISCHVALRCLTMTVTVAFADIVFHKVCVAAGAWKTRVSMSRRITEAAALTVLAVDA